MPTFRKDRVVAECHLGYIVADCYPASQMHMGTTEPVKNMLRMLLIVHLIKSEYDSWCGNISIDIEHGQDNERG